MSARQKVATFNSPLEAGLRALSVLVPAFPATMDLQRLVAFDYLVVHTADAGGPESLHAELPLRPAELLVRRQLVERGLMLMMSRTLVERIAADDGISYRAGEMAETFLVSLTSPYLIELRACGEWVVDAFNPLSADALRDQMDRIFGRWIEEFQAVQRSLAADA
ncbi:ABC-three component system middle component 2 [Methylocella sp.]|uniref:ABC-three component system middle component 2 n=1 Tax=Methylocella sp. TaxID=1978226 RepID=UPI0037841308